ncbi:type I secretion system permease/ATPase [Limnohabitans sp. TS-CS-82]|uniref:type I secretion system permease/ATPase n=1 Tax=Limnohabitans sp. TS-CS-82 TaxID=2094193 RepID=UPI000CF2F3ED|nr:type I secretion system permease/ATPase [Limnohabitans sp. TS-CS-82]PQA83464.1 type I secretion system permease/ATPase [Limnohabitans sp. TS-CS-82]
MRTPEKKDGSSDTLLVCLAMVAKHLGHPVHVPAMRQGFALDDQGRIPPEAYPDLAQQHGLIAGWSRKPLADIPSYVLPVVVSLVDGRSCVLRSHDGNMATVWWAEGGMQDEQVNLQQLQGLAREEVLVVKLQPKRSDQTLAPMQGAAFSWFWGTLWRFRHFYVESMVATVVANVLTLASVFFTMNVYDRVVPTQAYASLWTLAIGTAIAIVLEFIMRWLKARLVDLGGKKADLAINATLLREVMGIRLENRPQSVGIFASSMRDFESLRDFFSSASLVVLADMPFVLLFLGMIAMVGGHLVWIPALSMPVLIAQGLWAQKPLMKAMRANMKEAGDKQSVLVESVLNLELLKAHNAESYLQRRWETSNKAGSDSYKEIRSLTNWIMGFTTAVSQLVTVAMVVVGVYMIHANMLTLGGLIASVILAGRAISPLSSVMSLAARYQQAVSSLETLDGLMKRPRDRDIKRTYVTPEHIAGGLEAQALEFGYPGEHAIPVIKRLSLKVEPGQRLALLGRVGSGKSTLLRLMAGLYTPLAGSVRLDGVEMQQIEPAEVRSCMGYVGQDPQLFMGTLRENMVLSEAWISDAKIIEVLKSLNMYDLVASHPRGLDMPITEAGGGLSGGQRQLLSIARMMLRDPQLVFMDEPTANMDQNTEAHVIAVLGEWLKGRTLLMSTHRPQLLEWADLIGVIEAGQCVAIGPKQEMIDKLSRGIDVKTAAAQR